MKKTILYIVLAVLCLNFRALAQNASTTLPLKIGDQVPDILINNIINYKDLNGKTSTSAKLSDFKGKLLILDFWATWCSPCVSMIPKMDTLQKEFAGKVQFLSVAYQSQKDVLSFLDRLENEQRKHYNLPNIINDKVLIRLFPHTYLPHYVWIDTNGFVRAITGYEEVSHQTIERFLNGTATKLPEKQDAAQVQYNSHLPLLINNNGGKGESLIYHSLLTHYTDGLTAGVAEYPLDSIKGLKITLRNIDLLWLYQTAYGAKKEFFPKNRIKLLVKDTSHITSNLKGRAYLDWLKNGNGYCYELLVPKYLAPKAYSLMQHDLSVFFNQYKADIEKQLLDCMVLVRTSQVDKLRSTNSKSDVTSDATGFHFQNQPLSSFIFQLNVFYMQLSPFPVLDETGYKGNVDLILNANPSNIDSMNVALNQYGLKLIKAKRKIDVIAIRDNVQNQSPLLRNSQ